MNEALIFWIHQSKNDKLDALRDDNLRLQKQHDALVARLDRLMTHLDLIELTGPRIVTTTQAIQEGIF